MLKFLKSQPPGVTEMPKNHNFMDISPGREFSILEVPGYFEISYISLISTLFGGSGRGSIFWTKCWNFLSLNLQGSQKCPKTITLWTSVPVENFQFSKYPGTSRFVKFHWFSRFLEAPQRVQIFWQIIEIS